MELAGGRNGGIVGNEVTPSVRGTDGVTLLSTLKEPNEQDRKGLCSDSPSSTYKHVLQFFMSIFRASVIAAESTNGLVYVYSYLAHAIATKDLACPVRMQTSPRCSSASSTDCHMNGTVDAGLSTVHSMEFQSSFASAVSAK